MPDEGAQITREWADARLGLMADEYREILSAPRIPKQFWSELSRSARAKEPHYQPLLDYHIRQFAEGVAQQLEADGEIDPNKEVTVQGPDIPGNLDYVDPELEPITQREVLAILAQFLWTERGEIVAGATISALHWLILTGVYAEGRERYMSLRELVAIGRLVPSSSQPTVYVPSELAWPLIITSSAVRDINALVHVRRHVPTFWKAKEWTETWLREFPVVGHWLRKWAGG
jgi:hypothetical protein